MTIKEQILQATDTLVSLKRARASYDEMKVAAIQILELRQQAEKSFSGRVKTRITAQTIASLLRS